MNYKLKESLIREQKNPASMSGLRIPSHAQMFDTVVMMSLCSSYGTFLLIKTRKIPPGMVMYIFNPSGRQRQVDLFEFKVSPKWLFLRNGLHGEFQDNQGCVEKACLKKIRKL